MTHCNHCLSARPSSDSSVVTAMPSSSSHCLTTHSPFTFYPTPLVTRDRSCTLSPSAACHSAASMLTMHACHSTTFSQVRSCQCASHVLFLALHSGTMSPSPFTLPVNVALWERCLEHHDTFSRCCKSLRPASTQRRSAMPSPCCGHDRGRGCGIPAAPAAGTAPAALPSDIQPRNCVD